MRVSLFYSGTLALIAVMVWLAVKPGLDRMTEWRETLSSVREEGFAVSGTGLDVLIPTERASVEFVGDGDARRAVIGSTGVVANMDVNGTHYSLPAAVLRAFGATPLMVTFEVRGAPEGGSDVWLARCLVQGSSDSQWVTLETSSDWTEQTVECLTDVGASRNPLIVILWSDGEGDAGEIELRRIVFKS